MPTTNSAAPIKAAKPLNRDGFLKRIADSLTGLVSGLGGEKDKLATTRFSFANELTPIELEAAFRSDWMARKLVNIPAYDATREWRAWQGDPDAITKIEDLEKRLGLLRKTAMALVYARLYGGGALVLGVNQGRNEEELDYEKIQEGDLHFVHAVSRHDLSTGPMVRDIASPYFGEPEYYERTSMDATGGKTSDLGVRFHPSRVVRFVGAARPDSLRTGEVWGDSILQSASDAVKTAGLVMNSSGQLVAEAKIDIIRIPGLSENMASSTYEQNLTRRFAMANLVKGVYSMLLLDKEEEWERQNVTFTGLPDVMQMALLVASGAGDIPATRFLSQSPAGLSSTGESDLRNYYDNVGSIQKTEISPLLERLDNVLIPSALGEHPDELFYLWSSLWQMTPKEKAEVDKAKADTYKIDVDSNLLDPVVLKKARENQLIEDGVYPGFESILEEFDGQGEQQQREQEALAAAQAAAAAGANGERPEGDPEGNPDDMPIAGEEVDPATKAKPRKPTASRTQQRDGYRPGSFRNMRKRLDDATPRTLYISRPLLNVDDIRKWAKAQGFTSILKDLHTTIIYSKEPIDWLKVGSDNWSEDDKGGLRIRPGGPRMMEQFGKAQVLVFGSDVLTYRNMRARDAGCSFDYDEYNPHLTITYDAPLQADQLAKVEPYQGELIFGPERFAEINPLFNNEEDVKESAL